MVPSWQIWGDNPQNRGGYMPKKLEAELKKEAGKKGVKDKEAYVYGTMTNLQKQGAIKPWRKLKKR
jgi:hypothetical protein